GLARRQRRTLRRHREAVPDRPAGARARHLGRLQALRLARRRHLPQGGAGAAADLRRDARHLTAFSRRASSVASASSQFRNVAIFGTLAFTFGQTIQYVLGIRKETSIGRTRRPLMSSQAASAVRASATPWPSTARSINMLA